MLFGNLHILRLIFLLSYIFRLKMNTNDLCRIVAVPANLIFRNPFSQQSTFHGTIPVYAMISSTNVVFHRKAIKRGRCWMHEKNKCFLHWQLTSSTWWLRISVIYKTKSAWVFISLFNRYFYLFQLQGRKKRMKTNRGRNCRRKEDICVNLENRWCTTTTTLAEDLIRNWLG